jgi:hypothetical protein
MRIVDSRGNVFDAQPPTGWRRLAARVVWAPSQTADVSVWKLCVGAAAYMGIGFSIVLAVAVCSPRVHASLGQLASVGALMAGLTLALRGMICAIIVRSTRAAWTCGACGYDLSGLTPQKDGCRVCPQCGGAWRD